MTQVPAKVSAEGGSEEVFILVPSANAVIAACWVRDHMDVLKQPCGIPHAAFFVGAESLSFSSSL